MAWCCCDEFNVHISRTHLIFVSSSEPYLLYVSSRPFNMNINSYMLFHCKLYGKQYDNALEQFQDKPFKTCAILEVECTFPKCDGNFLNLRLVLNARTHCKLKLGWWILILRSSCRRSICIHYQYFIIWCVRIISYFNPLFAWDKEHSRVLSHRYKNVLDFNPYAVLQGLVCDSEGSKVWFSLTSRAFLRINLCAKYVLLSRCGISNSSAMDYDWHECTGRYNILFRWMLEMVFDNGF